MRRAERERGKGLPEVADGAGMRIPGSMDPGPSAFWSQEQPTSHTRLNSTLLLTFALEEDMTTSTGEERNLEAVVPLVLHTSG